jgi:protein subunit release factor A
VGLTLYRLPEVLEGDLDELIAALGAAHQEGRLGESRDDED